MGKYFKWFFKAVRPHWGALGTMLFCHVGLAAASLAFVMFTKKLIDAVLVSPSAEIRAGWSDTAVGMAVLLAVLTAVKVALNAANTFLQSRTAVKIKNNLRQRLFDVYLRQQIDGSKPKHSGDVISRLQEDVRVLSTAFSVSVPGLVGTSVQFCAAFCYLLYLDARLAWTLVVILPLGLFISKFISRKIRKLTLNIRESDTVVNAHLQENIQHLTLLKSMEYQGHSAATLHSLQDDLYGCEMRRTRFSIIAKVILSLVFSGGYLLVFLWGVNGLAEGAITYGVMIAFMQLVGQVQRPLLEMSAQIPAIMHSSASIDRLIDIEMLPKEDDGRKPCKLETAGVRFDGVTFAYPALTDAVTGKTLDTPEPVLRAFSHDFKPGTKTAVVGHTGVGKSTIVKLMLSLLKPSEGHIYIYGTGNGGRRVELEASPATRCNMVYVPQGNSLFSCTIRENLLMGNPEATEADLRRVLHIASAEFVFRLPYGMDTQCFESGGGLSEGQAQRIAVARALLRPGSILLLDEFSSALDGKTENEMMRRLTEEMPDRTMIFITHREKILDYCDSVLKIEDLVR